MEQNARVTLHSQAELEDMVRTAIGLFDRLENILAHESATVGRGRMQRLEANRAEKEEIGLALQTKLGVLLSYKDAIAGLPDDLKADLRDRHSRFHASAADNLSSLERAQRVFKKFQGRMLEAARGAIAAKALRYDAGANLDSTQRRVVSTGILVNA